MFLVDFVGGFGGLSEGVEVLHFFDNKHGESLNRSNFGLGVVMLLLLLLLIIILCCFMSKYNYVCRVRENEG